MIHTSFPGRTYNAPFDRCHADGQTLQSPQVHGKFDDFGTKEEKKSKNNTMGKFERQTFRRVAFTFNNLFFILSVTGN